MPLRLPILIVTFLVLTGCAPESKAARASIFGLLETQQQAWNAGDLDGFLEGYHRSPDITFIGKEVARGFDGATARYRQAYPTREQMGTLRFSELEFRPFGDDAAMVLGRFSLDRTEAGGGPASGRFTVILLKTKVGWKIVHDHTSAL